ncbi:MAG: pyridoxal-phosphate dependent enzyme [Candidatus Izemoplasmatales bacterium]
MNNIGKTPLIRATNLEKVLNIKKIYLKIEGNNPTNSIYDRIAKLIVKKTIAMRKNALIIDGNKYLLKALATLSEQEKLLLLVPKYKNENWKAKILNNDHLLNLEGVKKRDLDDVLENLSISNQANLISRDDYNQLSLIAIEAIAEEIYKRYPGDIDNIFLAKTNNYDFKAYENVFLKHHLQEDGLMPLINISTTDYLNTKMKNLIGIDKSLIEEAKNLLTKHEHLKVKQEDAIAFAGFLKKLKEGNLKEGRHVIVLDSARSRINIQEITDFSSINKYEFVEYVENYLDKYSDSKEETLEAIEMAMKDGFVLVAKRNDIIDGICIIVNLKIDNFIPKYHLAYIGINSKSKGRGLGSELIKEAINLTNGNISLHVDLDNKNAKKLYKKMGFNHVYDRMIYKK